MFNVFENSLLSSPRMHLFDQNYSKNSNVVKYYYNLNITTVFYFEIIKYNILMWWKTEFLALRSH